MAWTDAARAGIRRLTEEQRFWAKVSPEPNSGCWLWEGSLTKPDGGYGSFRVGGRASSKLWKAHRWAWTHYKGPIPEGFELDHTVCRLKCCANPDHLTLMTHKENCNQPDGGASLAKAKTHCPAGHPYSAENTRLDRLGHRYCWVCQKQRNDARTMKYGNRWWVKYE